MKILSSLVLFSFFIYTTQSYAQSPNSSGKNSLGQQMRERMQQMMEKQQEMMDRFMQDDFMNDDIFSGFGDMGLSDRLGAFNNDSIQTKTAVIEKNGKKYKKYEFLTDGDHTNFKLTIDQNIRIETQTTRKTKHGQSTSSSTQILSIPQGGEYRANMTQKLKNKEIVYFEVPQDYIDPQQQLENLSNSLQQKFQGFSRGSGKRGVDTDSLDSTSKSGRKRIIPQRKI